MNKLLCVLLTGISAFANAAIGPLNVYLNPEYRTTNPVIDNIASVKSLTQKDINKSGARTFAELLTTLPAIEAINPPGNIPSVFMRGNEGSHTLLLIDGVKVANGGYANLDVVPLENIAKIEILKGPFSSLYGPGAIGGIIAVTTHNKQLENASKLKINYGSHNTKNTSFNTSSKNENTYINIALSSYSTDGINATTADTSNEKDSKTKKSISMNTGVKLNTHTDIDINFLNSRSIINFDGFGSDKPNNDISQFILKITHSFSDHFKSNLDIKKQQTNKQAKNFELTGFTLLNEFYTDNSHMSFGLETENDKAITDNRIIEHKDIFAQYQTKIHTHDILFGLRQINHKKFSKHTTYNFGWGKNINDNLRLNLSYGKATNLPSHYQNNLNITTNQTGLKPEQNKSISMGADYKTLSINIYRNETKDAFSYFDPDGVFNGDEYYINLGGINNKGIEIDYQFDIMKWNIDTSFNYSKSIDKNTKLQQGRRPNKSIHINAHNTYNKFDTNIQIIGKSKTWDNDSHSNGQNGGYVIANIDTIYKYNETTNIHFNIRNITNKNYEIAKGYNQLGRTFEFGLEYNF